MRWLEVCRHAPTKKGAAAARGSQLSQDGVLLARVVGESLGRFSLVLTSASPRAIETAVAMGYAVGDTVEFPSGYLPRHVEHHDQWEWTQPYRRYAELLRIDSEVAAVAHAHRTVWTELMRSTPDGGAALVICHGGGIEPALVACLPDADYTSWDAPFRHLDCARLSFDQDRFVDIQFHRVNPLSG